MFLRGTERKKNGKVHEYFSVVEERRLADRSVVQRPVLYLGALNTAQEAAWRRSLEVLDEAAGVAEEPGLFPEERPVPPEELDRLEVKLSGLELRRPRAYGDCWLACWLWRELELDRFWEARLSLRRGPVAWAKVLQVLVVNRLIDPGSEFRVHRQWFGRSALDELLDVDFAVAAKDRLYRCLDLLLPHKDELCAHLRRRWTDLFAARFDVLLYDLTSTYFEGLCAEIPKARHGYSRDSRPDCRQVVIALIVTPDGLPLAYEVLPGNTSDKTTLRDFLQRIEARYGRARRVWVMDRGIPTEDVLGEMRRNGVSYLVGTPKGRLSQVEQALLDKPWQEVREGLTVKLLEESGEALVLARSADRQLKERAIRRRKLKALFNGLLALRRRKHLERDELLQRLGALKRDAGRAAGLVAIRVPAHGEPLNRATFVWHLDVGRYKKAEDRDGKYILRTNLLGEAPETLWTKYIQLTQIEAAFKCLKSDLALRPIYHQVEPRVEAHILVAFLGYSLMATLRKRLEVLAPGLTPKAALETLAGIQMLDVSLPTTDGRTLVLPRYTQPEPEQALLLQRLRLRLPKQPPPRIRVTQVCRTPSFCSEDSKKPPLAPQGLT